MLLFGLIAAFLISELVTRVFLTNYLPLYTYDANVDSRLRKNLSTARFNDESGVEVTIKSNKWGLRDENWQLDGTGTRILVIGDSFVEAKQVEEEDRFTEFTESYLKELGHDVTVANCGVPGAGPGAYVKLLKYCTEIFQPDINVIAFYSSNDFADSSASFGDGNLFFRERYTVTDGSVVQYSPVVPTYQRIKWTIYRALYMHSEAAAMIHHAVTRIRAANRQAAEDNPDNALNWVTPYPIGGLNSCPTYTNKNDSRMVEAIQISEHLIGEMLSVSSQPLLMIDIPSKAAVLNEIDCEWEFPEIWLADLGNVMGFEFLPVLTSMREIDESLYWGHLKPEGHRLLAGLLSDKLEDMLLKTTEY